jgi:large subunit ribosomal protein L30
MNDTASKKTDAASSKKSKKASDATVTVQLVRSVAGTRESHRATVRGLGLRKTNSTSTLEDTPAVRGMIEKVSYLVKVL